MTRRLAILALFQSVAGTFRLRDAAAFVPGKLAVELWPEIEVRHKGETVILKADDVFAALKEPR